MAGNVVVVGSLNQDLVAAVPHIPAPGETVLASGHAVHAGGKGANQAVAAARLGAAVSMVGRVGDDDFGHTLLAGLRADGIDTAHVAIDDQTGTGLALITVDPSGENAIAVSPGSNGKVSRNDVRSAAGAIRDADVVLLQLEVPIAALEEATAIARGTVILNPAPAAELPDELLEKVDVLVPNETELALLAGIADTDDEQSVMTAARSLPVGDVVVTLGARGVLIVTKSAVTPVRAVVVDPVDTTGAGDAFCGAIAAELARGAYLQAAARFATRAAALSVTRHGAQPSMPTRAELADGP